MVSSDDRYSIRLRRTATTWVETIEQVYTQRGIDRMSAGIDPVSQLSAVHSSAREGWPMTVLQTSSNDIGPSSGGSPLGARRRWWTYSGVWMLLLIAASITAGLLLFGSSAGAAGSCGGG
jgi:hypothetical protein